MPETTPTPAPAPEPQPGSSSPASSGINQALALSLSRVDNVTKAVVQPDRITFLSADGSDVTEPFLEAIFEEVGAVRKLLGIATQKTTEKEIATEAGLTLEEQLVQAIQAVQARARQKHTVKGSALANYHIGDRLGGNRAVLEQASEDILTALETDQLPGITPAKIAALKNLRQRYVDTEHTQTGTGGDASATRVLAKARVDALVEKRQKIQFAADAIWPWHDSTNIGIRKEFDLPASRPYAGWPRVAICDRLSASRNDASNAAFAVKRSARARRRPTLCGLRRTVASARGTHAATALPPTTASGTLP